MFFPQINYFPTFLLEAVFFLIFISQLTLKRQFPTSSTLILDIQAWLKYSGALHLGWIKNSDIKSA